MIRRLALLAVLGLSAGCATGPLPVSPPPGDLRLVSWNLEHLAERDGSGCRPRATADYAALRTFADALDADVIAFQEVESAAAAARVFDPARYVVVIENRPGSGRGGLCRGEKTLTINAQRTGFAIRRRLPFTRQVDLTALQLDDPDLRSGVDITVRPPRGRPLRLLSVHLKSGCAAGTDGPACATLWRQVPQLEGWIDARASEGDRFAVLGDFNRRLALAGDMVWREWDDGIPAASDLTAAAGARGAACDPRYPDFIDHIILDRRARADLMGFDEIRYEGPALSDHCPIAVTVRP